MPYELGAKWAELVQKFVPRSRVRIFLNEGTQSTPFDPKLTFWFISNHLGAFGTVRLPYKTRGKMGRTCKSSYHEVASEFFAMNPPDPLHCSLNSCFGAFRTVWVYLRPFGCLTKLGAKHSELVQKFVPRSRVRIFRDKPTRSTPSVPKLMFWCVLYRLGVSATIWLPYETRGKSFRTSAKIRATNSRRNFPQRKHPIHRMGP